MTIKITYIDGKVEDISAETWQYQDSNDGDGSEFFDIIERKFDADGDYDEDDDKVIATVNSNQVRSILKC